MHDTAAKECNNFSRTDLSFQTQFSCEDGQSLFCLLRVFASHQAQVNQSICGGEVITAESHGGALPGGTDPDIVPINSYQAVTAQADRLAEDCTHQGLTAVDFYAFSFEQGQACCQKKDICTGTADIDQDGVAFDPGKKSSDADVAGCRPG